jgi:hypothetical protein
MSGINCKNVAIGINFAFPNPGFMTDFTLTNSQFSNISGSAVIAYGNWTASGNSCDTVAQNCFVNQGTGNLNLGINTITNTGAYFQNTGGGTMQFDYHAYLTNAAAPTNSPGTLANVEAATAGSLTVNFSHTFNTVVGCTATVEDPGQNAGSTVVPQLWIEALDTLHAVFNTSSTSFNGLISWRCEGQLQ